MCPPVISYTFSHTHTTYILLGEKCMSCRVNKEVVRDWKGLVVSQTQIRSCSINSRHLELLNITDCVQGWFWSVSEELVLGQPKIYYTAPETQIDTLNGYYRWRSYKIFKMFQIIWLPQCILWYAELWSGVQGETSTLVSCWRPFPSPENSRSVSERNVSCLLSVWLAFCFHSIYNN